jgi:quinol monooxygenase YgiN
MYGTIYRIKVKPGKLEQVLEHLKNWERNQLPKATGVIASYHLQLDNHPDELLNVAIFDSEENYRKNAQVPGQAEWYRGLRELLESEPEWNDGRYIYALQATGAGL